MATPPDSNDKESSSAKVPANYKLRATFDKPKYYTGENATVTFSVENTGKEPITIETGGDYRGTVRSTRFHVRAVAADGVAAPDPHPDAAKYCMGGLGGPRTLNCNERAEFALSLPLYARIDRPGRYKVTVSHDLGWKLPAEKAPTASVEVEFAAPTVQQASAIVDEIYKSPEVQLRLRGEQSDSAESFNALCYPIFLAPLQAKLKQGSPKEAELALQAIGTIASPEATSTLIDTARSKNEKLAVTAAKQLAMRLPDPQLKGELPKRNVFEVSYDPERKRLVKEGWKDSFAPSVRELGCSLLNSATPEKQALGAFMLQCVGNAESTKILVATLDTAIRKSMSQPFEPYVYPRPRGNVAELMRTAEVLARPEVISSNPKNLGEAAMYMILVGKRKEFRPADWQRHYLEFVKSDVPFIRQLALGTVPTPVPDGVKAALPALLKDTDLDVQIAACELVTKLKDPVFKKNLADVLAKAQEQWLVNAASNALSQFDRVECMRGLASKLDDPKVAQHILSDFIPQVFQVQSWGSRCNFASGNEDSSAEGRRVKSLWLKFINDNEAFFRGGGRLKVGDPRITCDYLPHNMCLGNFNGKEWPPLRVTETAAGLQDKTTQERLLKNVRSAFAGKWQIKSFGTGIPDGWITSNKSPCFRVTITDHKKDNSIWFVPSNWIAIRKPSSSQDVPGKQWDCIIGNSSLKALCQPAEYQVLSNNFRQVLGNAWTVSLINSGFSLSQEIFRGHESEADQKSLHLVLEHCKTAAELNEAAISLIELGVPAKQVFLKAAKEVKGDTTWFIAAMRHTAGKEAVPVLIKMLGDPSSTDLVRERGAQALLEIDPGAVQSNVAALTMAMQTAKGDETIAKISRVIATTGAPQAGNVIFDAFNRLQNPYYKIELADSLANLHCKRAVPALQKLEAEINNCKDGQLGGDSHFRDWQLQEMRQKIKSALKRLSE